MTKHDAIKAYFEPKVSELAGDMLNFNFSPESEDSISLITNYSDKVKKKYITGDVLKEYGFTIVIVKSYSSCQDDLNLEAMKLCAGFLWTGWISRMTARIFQTSGEECEIQKMENLQNMPNLSGVNQDGTMARYMIQARVIYKERKKRT